MYEKLMFIPAVIAKSASFNPIIAIVVVWLFWAMLQLVFVTVEKAIFGKPFQHFLDHVSIVVFIVVSCAVVWICALNN